MRRLLYIDCKQCVVVTCMWLRPLFLTNMSVYFNSREAIVAVIGDIMCFTNQELGCIGAPSLLYL